MVPLLVYVTSPETVKVPEPLRLPRVTVRLPVIVSVPLAVFVVPAAVLLISRFVNEQLPVILLALPEKTTVCEELSVVAPPEQVHAPALSIFPVPPTNVPP